MATAIELLHIATLVHDDTVDNSTLRRGMETVNSLWGKDIAVQLGDYIFALSATFVCNTNNIRVIRRFSETIMELSSGQLMEFKNTRRYDMDRESYDRRIYLKTASLFRTAAESGSILGGSHDNVTSALVTYGHNIGMAFQIVDDILDFEGTEDEVGKPVGHDLLQGTLTLPAMLLLERYPENNPVIRIFKGEDPKANRQLAIEMIRNSSIIEDSYAVAQGYLDTAATAIKILPDIIERRSLLALLDYVTERKL